MGHISDFHSIISKDEGISLQIRRFAADVYSASNNQTSVHQYSILIRNNKKVIEELKFENSSLKLQLSKMQKVDSDGKNIKK